MLFEIFPLVVYQMAGQGLTEVPVEMIAAILRFLDPESLLNVVNTYKKCMQVSIADPILRRRLRKLMKEKKKQEMERLMNPGLGLTVIRKEPSKMFNTNVIKNYKIRTLPKPGCYSSIPIDFGKGNKDNLSTKANSHRKYTAYRL